MFLREFWGGNSNSIKIYIFKVELRYQMSYNIFSNILVKKNSSSIISHNYNEIRCNPKLKISEKIMKELINGQTVSEKMKQGDK